FGKRKQGLEGQTCREFIQASSQWSMATYKIPLLTTFCLDCELNLAFGFQFTASFRAKPPVEKVIGCLAGLPAQLFGDQRCTLKTGDENEEKYQLGDYKLIQYEILQTNITRTVWQTVRKITNEILGVKGLNVSETSDENKEKYQSGGYKLISYIILQTNIARTVWQT
ncbi:hypothetical protein pdam_00000669, partial [Pocillopora damicornis]